MAKLRLAGDQLAVGVVPVPESVADGAAPVKSPDTAMVPLLAPWVVGVNVTAMLQLDPGATDVPQLLVSAKSPVAWIPVRLITPLPMLVSVKVWGALVASTFWLANVKAVGESAPALLVAVPERLTDDGVAVKSPPTVSDPPNGPD